MSNEMISVSMLGGIVIFFISLVVGLYIHPLLTVQIVFGILIVLTLIGAYFHILNILNH